MWQIGFMLLNTPWQIGFMLLNAPFMDLWNKTWYHKMCIFIK